MIRKLLQASGLALLIANSALAAYTQFYSENFETGYVDGATTITGWTLDQNGQSGDNALKIRTGVFDNGGSFYLRGGGGGNIVSNPDTFNTAAGNVTKAYTIQAGDYVRVTFRNPAAVQHGASNNYITSVQFFYWEADGVTQVNIDSKFGSAGRISGGSDTGHLSFHAIMPDAANGKRLGVKFTMEGTWAPALDEITLAYERTADTTCLLHDNFSNQADWTGGSWLESANINNARYVNAVEGASGATTQLNYDASNYLLKSTDGVFVVKWVNADTREYPQNAGNYGIKVALGYWETSTKFTTFTNGETSVSGAIENEFRLEPTVPHDATGKKLGILVTFAGGWAPAIDSLVAFSETVDTPVIGFDAVKTNSEINWSVEEESGVQEYLVEKLINGSWTEVARVSANGIGLYSLAIDEPSSQYRIITVDFSGASQTFLIETDNEISVAVTKGWNLLSTPFNNTELPADATIWSWVDGKYGTIEVAQAGQGFWFFAIEDAEIILTGEVTTETTGTVPGWNLIGPLNNAKVAEGQVIFSWNQNYQQILDKHETLIMGQGYWLFDKE